MKIIKLESKSNHCHNQAFLEQVNSCFDYTSQAQLKQYQIDLFFILHFRLEFVTS